MTEKEHKKQILPRPRDYEEFSNPIEKILKEANEPLTWSKIKAKAGFHQKVPNNKGVSWMEEDIGLIREKRRKARSFGS